MIARRLATDGKYYDNVRERLIATSHEQPHHLFWDIERYAAAMEIGFMEMWLNYLAGQHPRMITVPDLGPELSRLSVRSSKPQHVFSARMIQ